MKLATWATGLALALVVDGCADRFRFDSGLGPAARP